MDIFTFFPIVTALASVTLSLITIYFSLFRGPDISLINPPTKIEIDNKDLLRVVETTDYVPKWISLKPVSFVFANQGAKSGIILDMKFEFIPNGEFKSYFKEVSHSFAEPLVIKKGEITHFKANPSIRTIDWKKAALASILNEKFTIKEAVELATEKGKMDFKSFCRFLESSTEFGKMCCTITFTGGRLKTKVKKAFLFKDVKVPISFEPFFLRKCVSRWEILEPVKEQLITELTRDLKEIINDLKEGLDALNRPLDERSLSQASKLRIDAWNSLRKVTYQPERKIRRALIEQEKGLMRDLTELFKHLSKYNRSIDGLSYLGGQRTKKHFQEVNNERKRLIPMTTEMQNRLSNLLKSVQ